MGKIYRPISAIIRSMKTVGVFSIMTAAAAIMLGCTHPADVSRPLTDVPDPNAHFLLSETTNGFTVEVRYSRYQFVPEMTALLAVCRSLAMSRAYDEAKHRHRAIQSINEQTIHVSTGRNVFHARTSCRAFAEAKWANNAEPASAP